MDDEEVRGGEIEFIRRRGRMTMTRRCWKRRRRRNRGCRIVRMKGGWMRKYNRKWR